jgi:DNA repair protein RadA
MVDSPHHPEQEVIFTLTEAGVSDLDSDTKKKSTKTTKSPKVESNAEPEAKTESKSDSSVDLDSKTEDSE